MNGQHVLLEGAGGAQFLLNHPAEDAVVFTGAGELRLVTAANHAAAPGSATLFHRQGDSSLQGTSILALDGRDGPAIGDGQVWTATHGIVQIDHGGGVIANGGQLRLGEEATFRLGNTLTSGQVWLDDDTAAIWFNHHDRFPAATTFNTAANNSINLAEGLRRCWSSDRPTSTPAAAGRRCVN